MNGCVWSIGVHGIVESDLLARLSLITVNYKPLANELCMVWDDYWLYTLTFIYYMKEGIT